MFMHIKAHISWCPEHSITSVNISFVGVMISITNIQKFIPDLCRGNMLN